MRSQLVSFWAQPLMMLTQVAPAGSGSRPRKSRYCCRTKKLVLSIGLLGPSTAGLSKIVTVAIVGELKLAPDGLLSITRKVRVPLAYESAMMATENDFEVSPAAN